MLRRENIFVDIVCSVIKKTLRQVALNLKKPKVVASVNNNVFEAANSSDIAELLPLIFSLAMIKKPRNILELGTRGGESTRALLKVSELLDISGFSVDLAMAPNWLTMKSNWSHTVQDDISFGKSLVKTQRWPNGEVFDGIDF